MKVDKDFFKKEKQKKEQINNEPKVEIEKTITDINSVLLPNEQILWEKRAMAEDYAFERLQQERGNVTTIHMTDSERGFSTGFEREWSFKDRYNSSIVLFVIGIILCIGSLAFGMFIYWLVGLFLFVTMFLSCCLFFKVTRSMVNKKNKEIADFLYIITDARILKLEGKNTYALTKEIPLSEISYTNITNKYETSTKNTADLLIVNKNTGEEILYAVKDAEFVSKKINELLQYHL